MPKLCFSRSLRGAALFVAHHEHGPSHEFAGAAEDGGVLAVIAVARELDEIGDERGDVIAKAWPLGMAGDLGFLPGIEL